MNSQSQEYLMNPKIAGELPVVFESGGQAVHGILHKTVCREGECNTGIVFCHGWSGSRLGPHRMFVKIARKLADRGVHCLRVDFRGRGDSEGDTCAASIQTMIEDTKCAVSFLCEKTEVAVVYLLGICSGGKVAIGAAAEMQDAIGGLIVWSAEAMGDLRKSSTNRHKTLHAAKVYLSKMLRPSTWWRLIRRDVNVAAVGKAMFRHETRSETEAENEIALLARFRSFSGPVLFVYGGNDPDTRLAGDAYRGFCARYKMPCEFHNIPDANHSFYSLAWEKQVIDLTEAWLVARIGQSGGS
ncbi:MAG: alpha/beta hydrolase [Candidatus Pacebacteria bacterium]|nr:alpha/beta hydrolase [Candidatus Paceibacterota bacterium]